VDIAALRGETETGPEGRRAQEEILAIARAEGTAEVLDFAERLLLRIRLDEEVFYRAALLIRNYLRLRARKESLERTSSDLS